MATERTVYIIELRDKFTMGITRAAAANDRFVASTAKARTASMGLSGAFGLLKAAAATAATYGIFRLGQSMVGLTAKFETTRKAFDVMLGDKGMGGALFDWAKEFSRTTIVTFDQTVTTIRKLLAYGIPEVNIRPLTRNLTEIAAGVGIDRLPYLTLALGQVYSRGRLMGTELRQFREHGVDVVSEIAKMKGLSNRTVEDMVTAGKISFDDVALAMQKMTSDTGRFFGMLAEQAQTLTGRFNILKSSFQILMTDAINPMIPTLVRWIGNAIDIISKLQAIDWTPIKSGFNTISQAFQDWRTGFPGSEGGKSFLRILYEGFINDLFDVLNAFDWVGTEANIFARSLMKIGDILYAITQMISNPMTAGGWYQVMKGVQLGQNQYAAQQRGMRDWRQEEREALRQQMLLQDAKPKSVDLITGAFVPGLYDTSATEEGRSGKTGSKTTSRTVGTGARDIVINIENLVNNLVNNNGSYEANEERMKEKIIQALLTAVNDVSYLAK